VDTPILLNWGTPIVTFVRSNLSVEKAAFEFDLGRLGVLPGVTINWTLEGESKTATSNAQGKFTGDATGEINYATGIGKIIPNKLPQKGTVFSVIYNYGQSLEQTKMDVAPDANQKMFFNIGTGPAIQPNSIELEIPVQNTDRKITGTVRLFDVPVNVMIGNLVNERGQVQGSITYATGAVEVTPVVYQQVFRKEYLPMLSVTYASA